MKKINNIFKILFYSGVFLLYSCDSTELDLTDNPNRLSPSQASPDFFLNSIQEDFARTVEGFGRTAAQVTRMDYMSGRDYANAYSAASFNTRWRVAYQNMMSDIHLMNDLAIEAGLTHHVGMGQVMEAYTLMTLVDMFGNVPYTEAFQGSVNLNPVADDGAAIYAAAISLLDAAIVNFNAEAGADPQNDFFYNGDWTKWIKAANTIKMKAYMTTRLVDADAINKFNAIVTSGDFISDTADDFQFRWGTNEIQPDTRHPRYLNTYTSTGGGRYTSNSFMDYMSGTNDDAYFNPDHFDIRALFYFYRQVGSTPGIAGAPSDEEVLECGLIAAPVHYAGFTYCGVSRGWWGRDHGNDNGIPPDGFLRTLEGSYPSGGRIDDVSFESQVNGGGAGGNGITPVMLASWTKFMMAEVQMLAGDDAAAKVSVFAGLDQSVDKVINFAPTSDRFNWIFGPGNTGVYPAGPALADISFYTSTFSADLSADWDAADTDGKWDILAMQYFVASYGNGLDAYDFYRRTGYPTTLQPNIEPSPGGFIRSFFYPANYANNNFNATQKTGVDVQVFWDNNSASPAFPAAN